MKRILLLAGLMLAMCASAYAQKSFNDEQLRLRGNIERFLREEGYMPEIDSDGDIKFKREGSSYYVIIDARDTSPMYLTLCKYYSYGEKYNRSVMSANLADFNLKKGVKLVLFDDSYCLQAQMYLVNADSFNYVFYKLLKQLDALDEDIDDVCLSSGSGSSYSSGSNYSSSGSLLVNETFSSYSSPPPGCSSASISSAWPPPSPRSALRLIRAASHPASAPCSRKCALSQSSSW